MPDYNLLCVVNKRSSFNLITDNQEDKRFNYTWVRSADEARLELEYYGYDFDVIFINNDIEEENSNGWTFGEQIYRKIKETSDLKDSPFIIVETARYSRFRRTWLKNFADVVCDSTKDVFTNTFPQLDALIRRRDNLSNSNKLITRDASDGVAKYYFQNYHIFSKDVKVDSHKDLVFNYLLENIGRPITPIDIPKIADDIKLPIDRKQKAKERTRRQILNIRKALIDFFKQEYGIDKKEANAHAKKIICEVGGKYKYDNQFSIQTITRKALYQKNKREASSSSQEDKS